MNIQRRTVIKGLAGLPLATVLADPLLARAAAAGLESVSIMTEGGRDVSAALAVPNETPAPAVVLIHEWWGLNDQIKAVAADFAERGYLALAVDLFGGNVATTREAAAAQTRNVDAEAATDTMVSWIDWIESHPGSTGKVGVVGWCFGGGWALNASVAAPVDATVIYYGRVDKDAEALRRLQGPVLGHFATMDRSIDEPMVNRFLAEMKQAGQPVEAYWYEADHAFANPTGNNYDKADTMLARERTLDFLEANLKA